MTPRPRLLVLSSLFPHAGAPNAGVFVRERMFRVARELPMTVLSPQPWSPFDALIRRARPGFRPPAPVHERQQGIEVHYPRFPSLPGVAKSLDARAMARASLKPARRIARERGVDLIDAHFAWPDGVAALHLANALGVPYTITLRGTEPRWSRVPRVRAQMSQALRGAARVIGVSDSLGDLAVELGASRARVETVGNGVDTARFRPADRLEARQRLGISPSEKVLITVGGLCERKGFHRVIDALPALVARFGDVRYLVIGGPGPEGDWTVRLQEQARALGVADLVRFLGVLAPDALSDPLSAADVFVLASRNEGWANVLLEAMACGLPVVASDVGGNAQVVCRPGLGTIVPFGDASALARALETALDRTWDRASIIAYAHDNAWDRRVARLVEIFTEIAG